MNDARQTNATATPAGPGEVGLVQPRDYISTHEFIFESGQKLPGFTLRYETYTYLYITRAIDHFDLAAAHGTLEKAFAPIDSETLVIGFTSDWLFPPAQNREIVLAMLRRGKRASYVELATDLGHDSFLLESDELYNIVRGYLK